jgi:hypothetical protein
MNIRKIALGGAAAVAFAGLLSAAPAYARTSHPATPEEMQQTDALNAQALSAAQGNQSAAPTATAMPQASPTMLVTTAAATPTAVEPPEGDTAMPATPAAPVTTAAVTPLTSMPTAPTLTTASVQGSDGSPVGMVNKVIIGTDGKPASVNVALSDNSKVVAIAATELSFDSAHNILVASLTKEQIQSLPAATG